MENIPFSAAVQAKQSKQQLFQAPELVRLMKQHCPTFLVLWQLYLAWAADLDST